MDGERSLIPCHFASGCARRGGRLSRRAQLAKCQNHPLRKFRQLALRSLPGLLHCCVETVKQCFRFEGRTALVSDASDF